MKPDLSSYQNLTERVGREEKGLGEGKVKRKKEEEKKEKRNYRLIFLMNINKNF